MMHVSCILLLEWSTTSQRLWVYRISVPYAQKDPRFLFEKRRRQPREFWSLFSTIDGSTLPQDCVEVTGKTYNQKNIYIHILPKPLLFIRPEKEKVQSNALLFYRTCDHVLLFCLFCFAKPLNKMIAKTVLEFDL